MEKSRQYGKGKAWVKSGVYVLNLQGTNTEMAAQHGALLKDEIRKGPLPYLGTKVQKLIERSHLFRDKPWLQKLAVDGIETLLQKPMLAQVPSKYQDETRAIAEACGIPLKQCRNALLQADMLTLLFRFFSSRYLLGHISGGFPGCTSLIALPEITQSGHLIHARNMDYPAVGVWDPYPTVLYFNPQGSDRGQRYVSVISPGLHSAGVTATNEAGITLSTHFHCAKAVSPFGTPIPIIGTEIIRRAESLDQAIDIAREFERAGSWSLVLSSAKENRGLVLEMVHGKLSPCEAEGGRLVHTNHFHTPAFQKNEYLLSTSVAQDYFWRRSRALMLIEESRGKFNREAAARILGDHFDLETGKVRAQGNTISVVTTVTSYIGEPALGRFWVANSGETPVCLGDYLGLRFDETFENFDSKEPELLRWNSQNASTIHNTPKREAFRLFRKAYVAYHTHYDIEAAAKYAEQAAAADPEEGHYLLAKGHFEMRFGNTTQACESFRAADRCTMSAHMHQVAQLYQAHALDCLGSRQEALAIYQNVRKTAVDPQLRAEAKHCLRRSYNPDRAWKMAFDLQFCDAFEYA